MNLACLVMTLVCLITILLFSGSNSSGGTAPVAGDSLVTRVSGKRSSFPVNLQTDPPATGDGGNLDSDSEETIDSLDSQPLIRSSRDQQKLHNTNGNDSGSDGFDDKTESPQTGANGGTANTDEREREEMTTTTTSSPNEVNPNDISQQFNLLGHHRQHSHHNPHLHRLPVEAFGLGSGPSQSQPASIVGPILSELFQDMDFGSLIKSLRNRTLAAATNGGKQPTIIRKVNKNGATIIISSSGTFNESSLNDSSIAPFPSLLERLLPPMFSGIRPMRLDLNGSSNGNETTNDQPIASATITINAEPIFSQSSPISSMLFPSRFMDSTGPFLAQPPSIFGASQSPFGSDYTQQQQELDRSPKLEALGDTPRGRMGDRLFELLARIIIEPRGLEDDGP